MSNVIKLIATPARAELWSNEEPQVVYVQVRGRANVKEAPQTALNLCLAIDRSSSMRGERLYHVKEAARHLVSGLGPDDAFALVTFNDRAEVVVPASKGADHSALHHAISGIEARGGTEMAQGMSMALQQLDRHKLVGLHRLIVLTDGRTYGDEHTCIELARRAQRRGIGLTALGVGTEWNEDLLETMTAGENSRTQYITTVSEIVPVFEAELQRLRSTIAQRVELTLLTQPTTQVRALHRVEPFIAPLQWDDGGDGRWRVPLGEWPADGEQHVLVELVLGPCEPGQQAVVRCELRYDLVDVHGPPGTALAGVEAMAWPWPNLTVDIGVKQTLQRVMAYRLQAGAWQAANEGRVEEATRRLQQAGTHLINAGQKALAAVVQNEATRMLKSGMPSTEGRKRVKYGTRGLLPPSEPPAS